MQGGAPDTSPLVAGQDYRGYVLADTLGGTHGAYLFSGTGPQLVALNALATVTGIVAVTEAGGTRWAELDGTTAAGIRTKLNTFLTSKGQPTIPTGWTYRKVIETVFKRLNADFSLDAFDVAE